MPTNTGSPTPRKHLCEIRASDGFGALSVTHRQAARNPCIDASTYWRSERHDLHTADSQAFSLPASSAEGNNGSVRTTLP